ncbi:PTI1-like tyrosine-protein kinase 2 [Lolium rigidum]|uniref:PTI1-like tyrosine-protein kinase 2 n=1 Tax=Lolium rigidum TaxID=89674 RepID=UPI001F5C898D|nr:PTI1-like tyrosine-protein kinase 2 [Lolium rigidum]
MKCDIYSFGVVLLEILTGQLAEDCNLPGQSKYRPLVTWTIQKISTGNVEQCVDPSLGGLYSLEAVDEMASLAADCVQGNANSRPSMSKVVETLSSLSTITSGSLPREIPRRTPPPPPSPSPSPSPSQPRWYWFGGVLYASTEGVVYDTPSSI